MSVDAETRRLIYIRETIVLIQDRASVVREVLFSNLEERDATFWRLFTLADAAHHLPDELKARHREIHGIRCVGFAM